jgi:DnaJ family protein A protein 2
MFNFRFGGSSGMEEEEDREASSPEKEADSEAFYKILGVEKSATKDEIKKAYRKMAMTKHPDKGGNIDEFKEIQKAYEVLQDDEKRELYDQYGEDMGKGAGGMGGVDLFDILMNGGRGRGGPGGRKQKRKGEDVVFPMKVTLADVYTGAEKQLRVTKNVLCKPCKGKGGQNVKQCKECKGQGARTMLRQVGPGMIQQMQVPCNACEGTGESVSEKDKCPKCKGKKVLKEKKTLQVHIVKGMRHQEKIVFSGDADEAPNTEPGDVVVVLDVQENAVFRREGNNLFMKKQLTLLEALTGFQFVIEHLNQRKLIVKSATNEVIKPGDTKSIQNEGMPVKGSPFDKGTLYIDFEIVFPPSGSITPKFRTELKKILPGPALTEIPVPSLARTEMDAKGEEKEIPAVEEASLTDVDMKEERAKHRDEQRRAREEDEEEGDSDDPRHHGHGHGPGQCANQ